MGYLQSTALAIPEARFRLVALYCDLNSVAGWASCLRVHLCNRSVQELRHFWRMPPHSAEGCSWYPPECSALLASAALFTDASLYAWGAHVHRVEGAAQPTLLGSALGCNAVGALSRGAFSLE